MRNVLIKEMRLSASPLTYLFILFGCMFLIPGYPILCGAFFVTLGIFHGFQSAREANDIVFSALLPISKRDVVRGKYLFVCLIEAAALALMSLCTALRMTAFSQAEVYRANALMNANPFALGAACVIFGLFNGIFVGGFFRTAYKLGKPFVIYTIVAFLVITAAESLHFIPELSRLNAFGAADVPLQLAAMLGGAVIFAVMTVLSCRKACKDFERIDL